MYIYIIIGFLIILFIFDILSNTREGMETKSNCDGELQTTVYKNAGAISNLQERIDSIMKQLNNIVTENDKQTAQISNLSSTQDKYDKIAQEADTTAKSNAEKILDIVKQAQKKSSAAKSKQESLPEVK